MKTCCAALSAFFRLLGQFVFGCFVLSITTLILAGQAQAEQSNTNEMKPLIVLVPGFFNSLSTEPNFARIINATIEARGYQVVAVDKLLSVGTVDQNGDRVDAYLTEISRTYPGRSMILLAHSAGGLYTLRALTKHPELPVKAVVTIATPYEGVEFVDHLSEKVPGINSVVKFINIPSLQEFKAAKISEVIHEYHVPQGVRWIAVAGYQPPCLLLNCTDSRRLSWILSITQSMMSGPSDGVVTMSSAFGDHVSLTHLDGSPVHMERWRDLVIPLEHWEIVQDSNLFHLLGVVKTAPIREAQVSAFNSILDRLAPELELN